MQGYLQQRGTRFEGSNTFTGLGAFSNPNVMDRWFGVNATVGIRLPALKPAEKAKSDQNASTTSAESTVSESLNGEEKGAATGVESDTQALDVASDETSSSAAAASEPTLSAPPSGVSYSTVEPAGAESSTSSPESSSSNGAEAVPTEPSNP